MAFRMRQMESRSEEHTSELQSRELISYAVFCLKKKTVFELTISLKLRIVSLGFRLSIYKLEYRMNSKIIGDWSRNPVWLIFIFMVTAEPGMDTSSHTLSLHDALPI